jgi:hypothetical protein
MKDDLRRIKKKEQQDNNTFIFSVIFTSFAQNVHKTNDERVKNINYITWR